MSGLAAEAAEAAACAERRVRRPETGRTAGSVRAPAAFASRRPAGDPPTRALFGRAPPGGSALFAAAGATPVRRPAAIPCEAAVPASTAPARGLATSVVAAAPEFRFGVPPAAGAPSAASPRRSRGPGCHAPSAPAAALGVSALSALSASERSSGASCRVATRDSRPIVCMSARAARNSSRHPPERAASVRFRRALPALCGRLRTATPPPWRPPRATHPAWRARYPPRRR